MVAFGLLLMTTISYGQQYILLGSATDTSGLSHDEQQAYDWAMTTYGVDAAYMNFATVSSSGLPADCQAVWFHLQDTTGIRADAVTAASTIETFVNGGGGMFLSGHATHYVTTTNVTTTGPTEVINNPTATADDAWGFCPITSAASHPVFLGLPATTWVNRSWSGFQTVTNGTQTQETISWWNASSFAGTGGTGLAGLPWAGDDITVCGEFISGNGRALVASTPGYAWGVWGNSE